MQFELETDERPRLPAEAPADARAHTEELAPYVVRESGVHGQGVFAQTPIRNGEQVGRFEGVPTQENGTYVLWIVDEDENDLGIEGTNALRFLNHADAPNAEFAGQDLYAICDVEPGAEILIHYGEGWEDHES